jgi:predicted Zn-dependent peptidase
VVPTQETVAKINAVTTADVCRAASRLFRGTPTLATMGPAERVPALAEIAEKLAA